jgi:hypothetical protein
LSSPDRESFNGMNDWKTTALVASVIVIAITQSQSQSQN